MRLRDEMMKKDKQNLNEKEVRKNGTNEKRRRQSYGNKE
jgi:hypothetical protein